MRVGLMQLMAIGLNTIYEIPTPFPIPTIKETTTNSLKSACAHNILKNKINYKNPNEVIKDCIDYVNSIYQKYKDYYGKEVKEKKIFKKKKKFNKEEKKKWKIEKKTMNNDF